MKIENMQLRDWNYTKATFDVVTKEDITIKNFRIVDTGKGSFIGLPQEKGSDGEYYNRVGMARELKDELTELALSQFEEMGGDTGDDTDSTEGPF
jgi:stage V sporulation protein G